MKCHDQRWLRQSRRAEMAEELGRFIGGVLWWAVVIGVVMLVSHFLGGVQ